MAMIDLIDVNQFTILFGFFLFAWASGYAVGYILASIRRFTYIATS